MTPNVGSWVGGFTSLVVPSPPSLPAAHTTVTPSLISSRCTMASGLVALKLPPALPQELFTTTTGAHSVGSPGCTCPSHGFAWCSSTQYMPTVPDRMVREAPVLMPITSDCGAAPRSSRPTPSVTMPPAAMPATCVP